MKTLADGHWPHPFKLHAAENIRCGDYVRPVLGSESRGLMLIGRWTQGDGQPLGAARRDFLANEPVPLDQVVTSLGLDAQHA